MKTMEMSTYTEANVVTDEAAALAECRTEATTKLGGAPTSCVSITPFERDGAAWIGATWRHVWQEEQSAPERTNLPGQS